MKTLKPAALSMLLLFSQFLTGTGYAAAETIIEMNGIKISTEASPIIINNIVYTPLKTTAELLELTADYNENEKLVTLKHEKLKVDIKMKTDGSETTVNGKKYKEAPMITVNNQMMVPVRFISEALGCKAIWSESWAECTESCEPRYRVNRLQLFSANHAIKAVSGAAITAEISFDEKTIPAKGDNRETNYNLDIKIPQLTGLKNVPLQETLNNEFKKRMNDRSAAVAKAYAENRAANDDYTWSASESLTFHLSENSAKLLSIVFEGESYYGGAHGLPYRFAYTIDTSGGKLMTLADILKNKNYQSSLQQKINEIRSKNSGMYSELFREDMLGGKMLPLPDEKQFYIEDGKLVIFYAPYEIAPYSRGFVTFTIPLD